MLSFALLSFRPHLSFAFYVSPARMIRCLGEIETDVFLAYRPQPTDYILTSPTLQNPAHRFHTREFQQFARQIMKVSVVHRRKTILPEDNAEHR